MDIKSGPKYDCQKALTQAEIRQIKMKLGIPSNAPFKLCPAKVKSKLVALKEKGEAHHWTHKHAPCIECGCGHVAGKGTSHYGYGLCSQHERSKRYSASKERIMKADLIAQQQRHPRAFAHVGEYLEKVEKDGTEEEGRFDLTPEMEKAKMVVNDIYNSLSEFDKSKDETAKNINKLLDDVAGALKTNRSLSPDDKNNIAFMLLDIQKKLTCPLTAKGSHGPVEMSTETRVKLQLDASDTLSKITERVQKLHAITMITKESFNEWLYKYHQELKKEFGTATYERKDGTFPIIEGVGKAMMETGDPRKGI